MRQMKTYISDSIWKEEINRKKPIEMKELEQAIAITKNAKAIEVNKVASEPIRYIGGSGKIQMLKLLNQC